MAKRVQWWLWGVLIGLAFALRLAGLEFQSLWRDEVDAIRFASRPWDELLRTFVEPGQNGPLYHLLLRPWLLLAGKSEFSLRFFSVVSGVLAVALSYRLARRLFPKQPTLAWLAAMLAATSPYLVWYSQEGKMYALVVALILLSMERYLAALEQGGWYRWALYVVATSAAFYVHLIAALIVVVQVFVFVTGRPTIRSRWKPWLISIGALTLPYLPLLAWQFPLLLQPAETGFRFVPLHEMLLSLLVDYSLGIVHGVAWWIVTPFVTLLLAAVFLWRRDFSWWGGRTILLGWLLLPVAAVFLITLSRPLYTARYLIFVIPAFLLLLGMGIVAVGRRSRVLAALLLISVLVSNGVHLWAQGSTSFKADFRAATAYVAERLAAGDLVVFQIPYGRYSFDYYFERQPRLHRQASLPRAGGNWTVFLPLIAGGDHSYRWADGLYTNGGMDRFTVDRRMTEITIGGPVVWLVSTEEAMWDERELVQNWLDEHGRQTDEAHFVRVDVRRYELVP